VEFRAIQLRNGCLSRLGVRHFNESETTSLPCITIGYDVYAFHASVGGECGLKVSLGGLVAEIADKNVGHSVVPLVCRLSLSGCSETNL
jgi:hypothetical protein